LLLATGRAVKAFLSEIDFLLVVGSRNSSNSNRLLDVARTTDVPSG
jgi:4-hydroxy-3-methylbut-2-enyl diphosphate reductase IspH